MHFFVFVLCLHWSEGDKIPEWEWLNEWIMERRKTNIGSDAVTSGPDFNLCDDDNVYRKIEIDMKVWIITVITDQIKKSKEKKKKIGRNVVRSAICEFTSSVRASKKIYNFILSSIVYIIKSVLKRNKHQTLHSQLHIFIRGWLVHFCCCCCDWDRANDWGNCSAI